LNKSESTSPTELSQSTSYQVWLKLLIGSREDVFMKKLTDGLTDYGRQMTDELSLKC